VRYEDDVRSLVDKTVARFGRLDIAVNNAATEGPRGLVTEETAESYAATFDTNVLGVLLTSRSRGTRAGPTTPSGDTVVGRADAPSEGPDCGVPEGNHASIPHG
jgi:NAD(P)-dependent dehydrogenase (short-subunit alcohol dehydrogenase family)